MESRKKNFFFFFFKKECDTTFSLSFFLVNTPAITTLEASYTIDKKTPTLWPLFMDGVQLPQGKSHFGEAVYFLPLRSQKKTKVKK